MNLLYLIYVFVCLMIVLMTLEYYVVSGFHARTHRLLPLVLGLLALYEFYLMVEALTGSTQTFTILKQLLLVQIIDVILYYILDLIIVKLTLIQNIVVFISLLIMDLLIFHQVNNPDRFQFYIMAFIAASVMGILYLVIDNAPHKQMVSNKVRMNNMILILAVFVPAIALLFSIFGILKGTVILPMSINFACLIFDYLLYTDRLREVDSVLKEEYFQTLDIPSFLFDTDLFFLGASKKARECFQDQIMRIEVSPKEFRLQKQLKEMLDSNRVMYRVIDDVFYRCELLEAKFNGKKMGYILTFMDITEQKAEADMAKEIARQKSDFLASMSHDLRSPLHAIIGSSEIVLSRGEMSSRNRTMVNHIHDAGNNLLDIVNSILDFSKLESGNFKLHPQKYSFKKLVEEQASLAFANLKDSEVEFCLQINDSYPEYLYGDELRVRQMVQNLVSNAIKFTEKGRIDCNFNIRIHDKDRVFIECIVKDTGCGMSKEQVKKVFADYVTYAGESKKEGTGLGLSIVRKLSEMMGGGAKAKSDGSSGSTFSVEFYQQLIEEDIISMDADGISLMEPLIIQSANEIDTTTIWKNEILPSYTYSKANVLIADDMAVNCEIFKELSSPWKINVDTAVNGLEAVNMAKEKAYDLIFLDQMMPVMSGIEAADEMNALQINSPKILLTANITQSMKELSKEHGLDEFMHKPIDISALKTNLEKFLDVSLREEYDASVNMISSIGAVKEEWYGKALEIYVEEMRELYRVLPGYKDDDMAMFRNKVHGIKGVSRQLGRETLALMAESLEMAAVTEHRDYINSIFGMFYGELELAIVLGAQELETIRSKERNLKKEEDEEIIETAEVDATTLFEALKVALQDYEMTEIETIFKQLDSVPLMEVEAQILIKVKSLYEDMEYEDALEVLSEYI